MVFIPESSDSDLIKRNKIFEKMESLLNLGKFKLDEAVIPALVVRMMNFSLN